MAEGVFKHLAAQAGRADQFQVESAGVERDVTETPDPRAQATALAHGIRLDSRTRQFSPGDFNRFKLVLALDASIAAHLRRLAARAEDRRKVRLLREYDPHADGDLDVPDPFDGGLSDFERAYDMIHRSCQRLLESLQ
jgi:protein-tyrosine phosphatase